MVSEVADDAPPDRGAAERSAPAVASRQLEGDSDTNARILALEADVLVLETDLKRLTKEFVAARREAKKFEALARRSVKNKSKSQLGEYENEQANSSLRDAREHEQSAQRKVDAKQRELDSARAQLAAVAGKVSAREETQIKRSPRGPKSPLLKKAPKSPLLKKAPKTPTTLAIPP